MQHTLTPHRCPTCVDVWRILDRAFARGELPTTIEVASAVAKAPRTVRVHVAELVRHEYLAADRRTPLRRCGPPLFQRHDGMTPRQWAASLKLECSACGRIMTVLAELTDRSWTTRGITQAELAHHAGMSLRTLGRHMRLHLAEGRWLEDGRPALLRREPAPLPQLRGTDGQRRWAGSDPDRYVLLSRLGPRETDLRDLPGDSWHTDVAASIVHFVRWFTASGKIDDADFDAAVRRVAVHLRAGYPEQVLNQMIHRRAITGPVDDPYALLISLLPPPGSLYQPPADPVTAAQLDRPMCPECHAPHRDREVPHGVLCATCSDRYIVRF